MGDVRGDFLGSPHGTTSSAEKANKLKLNNKLNNLKSSDPLEAVKCSKGDSIDYIAQFRVMNLHQ